ncbi:putative zinc finger CCHC domain-containing protein 4 isoform X2 [Apostichopus japonicus]|uniref:Putative zinc finger CCHC domain-containing protein 4 isoform X2 n=1 Tax=Stichopus japonicus TaxID=307972 RepID=A0A2G8L0P9_STIJA|nr:putative zinc finger CCHC domain-containing protein 4 isoform X2 [Apostichopus japonicus]
MSPLVKTSPEMSGKDRNLQGCDVLISEDILSISPHCEHGPTLLFEKYYGKGNVKRFFACSAYRDRKYCKFYQPFDEKSFNHLKGQKCSKMYKTEETRRRKLLVMRIHGTTEFLVKTIKSLHFDKVLCVGVPRLHETLLKDKAQLKIDSLLLDIDERFAQFFSSSEFCRYNMFNDYFFCGSSRVTLQSFLRNQRVLLVMDPPFGGLVEALAFTISQITNSSSLDTNSPSSLRVMWIFPYFMEKRILSALPNFHMLDYKVSYDNHVTFKNGSKSSKNSPVRIFTDISPAKISLPADEGYWYCSKCKLFSAPENLHCDKCNKCPSKDGSTYRHCTSCDRCVKPAYTHCALCKRCELPSHNCNRVLAGCHLCGDSSHKRRECPQHKTFQFRTTDKPNILHSREEKNLSREEGQPNETDENLERKRHSKNRFILGSRKLGKRSYFKHLRRGLYQDYIREYVSRRRLRGLRSTISITT